MPALEPYANNLETQHFQGRRLDGAYVIINKKTKAIVQDRYLGQRILKKGLAMTLVLDHEGKM